MDTMPEKPMSQEYMDADERPLTISNSTVQESPVPSEDNFHY